MLSTLRSTVRGLSIPAWTFPIALLALTLFTYGLRALSLGFYWDDLPYLWLFYRFGPSGIVDALAQDRPFLSFLYTTTLTLLGQSTAAWQIFALLARWLCSLSFWWMLVQAFPAHPRQTAWTAVLFAVYPGFTQQWISVIYGQAFLLYAPVFASIGITLWLARRGAAVPRWQIAAGTLAALALSAFSMFSTEYFFGLELLRPLLLVFALTEPGSTPFRSRRWLGRSLLWWLPFLLLMIAFVVWRAFFQVFPGHSLTVLEGLRQGFFQEIARLTLTILEDGIESTLAAWGQAFRWEGLFESNPRAGLRTLAVIALCGLAAWGYLARMGKPSGGAAPRWAWQAVLVGIFALLAGGWPFWITGLPMRMGFPYDRYALPLAPGASLLAAGFIDWLGRRDGRKAAAVALLVGLAAGFHNTTALQYRNEWNEMRRFFWQLSWRAPAIQPGTLLVMHGTPFKLYEDDSLLAPLNWIYDPNGTTNEMKVTLFDLQVRLGNLSVMAPGAPVEKDYRGMQFRGSTDRVLVLSYTPDGCLHVLNPVYDSQIYTLSNGLLSVLPFSNPQELITQTSAPAVPPQDLFGPEPDRDWCYYFANAALARERQDWAAIYTLGEASIDKGVRPENAAEYLPFIEGYLHNRMPDDAYALTLDAVHAQVSLRPALCETWKRAYNAGAHIPDYLHANLSAVPGCDSLLFGSR